MHSSESSPGDATEPQADRGRSSPFWRGFWLVFLVVSLAYAWHSFYVPPNTIAWADDHAAATARATETGQPVVLFVTGAWCVPCRIMKREVWADDEVTEVVNESVVPVLVDVDDPAAASVLSRYAIGYTPTTIITDAAGNVLQRRGGGIDKTDFLAMLAASNANATDDP